MGAVSIPLGPHSIDAMLDDLRTLVEIESPSLDLAALQTSAEALAAMIERLLGRPAMLIDSPVGPHVHWSGGGDPKVLLLGHHDTVFPVGALAQRPFTVADGHATGPGVFDMLAGIVQALHGLATLDDVSGVELLFSADEEIGSAASRAMIEERALACGAVLVLEPSADGGALKTGRKGCGTFDVVVRGRASHAGLEPEKGVNALVEVAHQVLAINELGRREVGTTVTPTVATAGTADNVVPALGRIKVDVRVESADEKARVEAAMAALRPVDPDSTIEVSGSIDRPPMPESASTTLMPLAEAVAARDRRLRRRWRQRRQLHRGDRRADARWPRCGRRGSARRPRVRRGRHDARPSPPHRRSRRADLQLVNSSTPER